MLNAVRGIHTLSLATLAALATLVPVFSASGQSSTTNFNVAAGLTLATSNFGDRNESGYNVAAGIGMTQRGSPLGFRAEGTYNEFNEKGTNDKSHAGAITLNALYNLVPPTREKPTTLYAIGGIGYYNTREPFLDFEQNQTNFGWNLGAGFRFPLSGFSAYLEARYHSVSNVDVQFIPISFGLVF